MAPTARSVLLFLATLFLPLGCSSGGNGGTGPGGSDGAISITVSPGTLTLDQGTSGQVTVTVTRSGGFTGSVSLSASGAPSGVTVQAGTIGSSASSTQLSVGIAGNAAAGGATVTIRAAGSGVSDATATFTLTVMEVQAGSFSLSLSASSIDLQQGTASDVQVSITRTGGFSGNVTLSASGLPSGVTASFAPSSVSGTSSTLTLTVSGTVVVGSYNLTITGTGSGVSAQTATLALGVTASGGGGGTQVSFAPCNDLGALSWLAYQDGNGPWTAVTPVGLTYSFELQGDRAAIAFVQAANMTVFHLSTEEMELLGNSGCDPAPPARTVTGSVTGTDAGDFVNLTLGPAFTLVLPGSPDFQFASLPEGPLDLIAAAYGTGPPALKKIIIRRDLNPAHNDVLPVLDFSAPEAVAPVVRNLTINNIQGETTGSFVRYVMSHGANGGLIFSETEVSASSDRIYHGVPAPAYQAGDLHRLVAQATSADLTVTRTVTRFFGEAVDQAITLPPAVDPAAVNLVATAPYVRLQVQYTPQVEFDQYYTAYFSQVGSRPFTVSYSGAYLNGGAIDFTLEDYSGMPGWDNGWAFQPGTLIEGTFIASGWTGGAMGSQNPVEGTIIVSSSRTTDDINP